MKYDVFVPVVKWTHYGRWTEDGRRVLGVNDKVIYRSPEDNLHLQLARAEQRIKESLAIRDARMAAGALREKEEIK